MDDYTSRSYPEARALLVAAFLIQAGIAFSTGPTTKGTWRFVVERQDDDVFARIP